MNSIAPCRPSSPAFTALRRWRAALLAAAVSTALPAGAQTLFVLTNTGSLATTTVTNPTLVSTPVAITGVAAGDTLVAIDVRAQNQNLYALGVNAGANTLQLYLVSTVTGLAAPIGIAAGFVNSAANPVDLPAAGWDIDFNPAVDRLRVVNANGQNFRMNPNTGGLVDGDLGGAGGPVTGVNMDGAINGATTAVNATAYTNNRPNNGNITTQYTLDAATNSLFIQSPPNSGTQTLIQPVFTGGVPLDFTALGGFDIAPGVNAAGSNSAVAAGAGLAVLKTASSSILHSIDLVSGIATPRGTLDVRSFAISPEVGAAIALEAGGATLIRFDPTLPSTTTTVATGALTAGETLAAIDGRPQTGQLYGLGVNATANTATLYLIDPSSGGVTVVGSASNITFVNASGAPVDLPHPATTGYGMDFNPTVDRIRIVTGNGLNFRVNPITGGPVDGNLNNTATTPPGTNPDAPLNGSGTGAEGTAYTNSYAQPLTGGVTTQYALSSLSDTLFIQNPPNAGTLTNALPITLGGAPLDLSTTNGFDIPATVAVTTSGNPAFGQGWTVASVGGGATGMYRIDLTTGGATSIGALGTGATAVAGLVVWAVEPNAADISAEFPAGTVIQNGGGTVGFGATPIGGSITRTIVVKNFGEKILAYTTTVVGSGFTVTQNAAANLATATSATLDVTFTASATGTANGTLRIVSNDPDEASFEIALTATGIVALTDDIAFSNEGETRLSPLANDELPGDLVITGVSNPNVVIAGRTLVIPAGVSGSFTYTVSNGTISGSATVTVSSGASVSNATRFSGLITDVSGSIFGQANVGVSASGAASVQVRLRAGTASTRFQLPAGTTPVVVPSALGPLTLARGVNVVNLTLVSNGRTFTGILLPAITATTPEIHHIALASISPAIPGGGYIIATKSATGVTRLAGLLPDGRPFSAGGYFRNNNTIAFYAQEIDGVTPRGFLGGELTLANLTKTDATGEIAWIKPPQIAGAFGTHLGGVNTILTANGSIYSGTIPLAGAGTLTLSGGNLAATQSGGVTVNAGIPTVPTAALRAWTIVSPASGRFAARVLVPGLTPAVSGGGIYIPKSNTAWGYFRGRTVGGRIELTVP